jgi:GNAT superfamily N-acetyltransferase
MNEYLSDITLKSGEQVQAVVISGPDSEWHERITTLLAHKGEIWRWQVAQLLSDRQKSGVETRFYLLHRDGIPFSNIMTVEFAGVGLFGHVWTRPEDRQQGAASSLMNQAINHFRKRGGRALYLGTGFDTPPFHLYRKFGFEPIKANNGTMHFATTSISEFEAEYFAPGDTEIVPFGWPQWAVSSALFTGEFSGVVRNVPFRLLGCALTEEALLPLVRQEVERATDELPRALVLQKSDNGAVVGLAAWDLDPLWPATCRVDVWCHPSFWEQAEELLKSLKLPDVQRVVAFSDAQCEPKATLLMKCGFNALATLPHWVQGIDVTMWEKGI